MIPIMMVLPKKQMPNDKLAIIMKMMMMIMMINMMIKLVTKETIVNSIDDNHEDFQEDDHEDVMRMVIIVCIRMIMIMIMNIFMRIIMTTVLPGRTCSHMRTWSGLCGHRCMGQPVQSYIRHGDFRTPSPSFVTLVLPPLDSEAGWTGELWSKTNLLNWQN